jgi:hypothetical protein
MINLFLRTHGIHPPLSCILSPIMASDSAPQARRVRFMGLSTRSINSAPLDGAVDAPSTTEPAPGRSQQFRADLKKKTSWKDFIPRVEYPGWPAAAFKPPRLAQWFKYFSITITISAICSGIATLLFLLVLHESHTRHESFANACEVKSHGKPSVFRCTRPISPELCQPTHILCIRKRVRSGVLSLFGPLCSSLLEYHILSTPSPSWSFEAFGTSTTL